LIRGLRASDLLVLVDGVEISNPLSPTRATDLSFSSASIAKMELLRGPHPVLYGNGAIGGVLNITSKRSYKIFEFSSSVSTAVLDMSSDRLSPDTVNSSISLSGGNDKFFYNGGASFFYTKGISMADSYKDVKDGIYSNEPELDKVIKGGGSVRAGTDINKCTTFDVIFRFDAGKQQIDDGPGLGMDDVNRVVNSRSVMFRPEIRTKFLDRKWEMKLNFSILNSVMRDDDPADPGKIAGDMESQYNANRFNVQWRNDIQIAKWNKLIFGAEFGKEWGEAQYEDYSKGRLYDLSFSPSPDTSGSLYLYDSILLFDSLEISAGVRLYGGVYEIKLLDEDTDEILSASTRTYLEPLFSGGISYETPWNSLIRARVGRGFSAPTLFQRFSRYANPYNELKSEESWGFDAGYRQYFAKKRIYLEGVYFYELKNNQIDLDKNGTFSNRYQVENHGLEFELATKPFWGLSLKASYTWIFKMQEYRVVTQDGKKYRDPVKVLRKPEHSVNAVLNWNFRKILNAAVIMNYVGKRNDEVYNYPKTPYNVVVDDFVLLHLALSVKVHKYLTILAKIENILDNDDYAYSVEYGTAGITPWLGLKLDI
jgi:vitamin B12 transporter